MIQKKLSTHIDRIKHQIRTAQGGEMEKSKKSFICHFFMLWLFLKLGCQSSSTPHIIYDDDGDGNKNVCQ